jgi:hypothetical protein
LVGALEVVEAAVKAMATGDINLDIPSIKTRKDAIRYAPSFVTGKVSDALGASHPYTADGVASLLGGAYLRKNGQAAHTVAAALGVLELEERKVKGFSEEILHVKTGAGPDGKYVGAKQIIAVIADIKQREVKAQERAEKSAEEIRAEEAKQQAMQAQIREREAKEQKEHDELLRKQMEALVEENAKEAKRLQQIIKDKAIAAEAKAEADKTKLKALDATLEAKKEAAQEQRKVDEYLPIRREADRIIHILERRDLEEDVKALSRRPLNAQDRERVRQAALTLGTWYAEWVATRFLPPTSPRKRVTTKEKK